MVDALTRAFIVPPAHTARTSNAQSHVRIQPLAVQHQVVDIHSSNRSQCTRHGFHENIRGKPQLKFGPLYACQSFRSLNA